MQIKNAPFKEQYTSQKKGFTLIELLLVIGIISVLAVVVFVSLDPAKRFADARDARRQSDVETISSAIQQFVIDNKGAFPSGIGLNERQLGTGGSACSVISGGCNVSDETCLDASTDLAKYLKSIPTDPQRGTIERTLYSVELNADHIVTVRACNTEGTTVISVSR
jgi:prepilin-type N-terminal cleavage/methylation domain-containing protein